jgi:ATP-dependent DNA helicase RecG
MLAHHFSSVATHRLFDSCAEPPYIDRLNPRSASQVTQDQQLSFLDDIEVAPEALWTTDDIWTRMSAEILKRFKEDRRLERKNAQFPDSGLGQYMSMWANTPGGGFIVVGQHDTGAFEGLKAHGTARLNSLEKAGKTYCPDVTYKVLRVPVQNAKGEADFVLVFRVLYHPTRVVKTNRGDAYTRKGDTLHRLSPDEFREIQADKKEVSFELEACNLTYPDDFNRPVVRDFLTSVKNARQLDDTHSETDLLCLTKLGRTDAHGKFVPNVACALLFATDPRSVIAGAQIRFLRFEGEQEGTGQRWNAVRDVTIEGTIPELIAGAAAALDGQLRTFSRLDSNGKFYAQPEYPKAAWYEAIVNACVHSSYGDGLRNTPIFVKMFDNRLVVESPGPFPPFVTPENIYESHNPKNPHLMEALRYLEYVKCAHEGTRRMRAEMTEMKLPAPEFAQAQQGSFIVRVTLKNNVHQRRAWVDRDVADVVGTLVAATLSEGEKRALNFLAEHGEVSVSDVQRLTGKNWHSSKAMLMRLVAAGILQRRARKGVSHDTTARFVLARAVVPGTGSS